MVCDRCIMVVKADLMSLGYSINSIDLGEVVLNRSIEGNEIEQIRKVLFDKGFELIDDKKSSIINSIKTLIIEYIHYDKEKPDYLNISDFLSRELGYDYSYLSNLFSSVEGITIEKFLILQKIEKVKELLDYDELALNDIAYKMGYSSVQHLSQQFKRITGLTPSHFKKIKENRRKSLDKI
jgi:AraC-like DNA-binding protein